MKARKGPRPARKKPARIIPVAKPSRPAKAPFPIVGIGASAGGLEALEQFLRHVPEGSGMAFAIVQHLDPTHSCIMPELLQRATAMPVVQVEDRLRVQRDHVYVIPPNKDMSILHGVLHLLAPTAPRGLRLPIDFFFRSLADDRQDQAIGVILSGMGTDGTLGLRAIKEKGGVVFVQEMSTAKFDGMPRSAVEAGLADVVASAADLPARILAFLQHVPFIAKPGLPLEGKTVSALEKVFILLRSQTGHDFSLYKRTAIYRRIERRMGIHQIDGIADYVRYLRENPHELDLLFKEMLIGVTSFFRDPAAWEQLKAKVLPSLLAGRPSGQTLRAWVPGCATGEEAYSLAIVFKEAMEKLHPNTDGRLQVFATDLDRDAIEKAREGIYPPNIAADVPAKRLSRFFVKVERGYQVAKPIREMIIFAPQNVVMDPPFTRLDILCCRNLLIYLTTELQKKLMPLFHYSLNPGGVLFLGTAETVGGCTHLFAPLEGRSRFYRRVDSPLPAEPVEFPSSFTRAPSGASDASMFPPLATRRPPASTEALIERMIIQHYSPAAVLVNDKGDVLYISRRTGKYLEPAVGKADLNIFAMAREGLRYELSSAFQKALRHKVTVTLKNVAVGTNGGTQVVDVTVHPLQDPDPLPGTVLIVLADVATPPPAVATRGTPRASSGRARLAEAERELHRARQELQGLREGMQISQEEIKSTNEELQSTNEELQSTNEELTTSKEEMQSLNEELQTVNNELQVKVDDLTRANNDMRNLLDSTEIATVFLDDELRLRRFTPQATKLTRLIPGDMGRPITDIASDLFYPELADDVQQALRNLMLVEKQVAVPGDRWFAARILPYRTLENMIDGVVITFVDITATKTLEAKLRKTQEALERRVEEQDAELGQAERKLRSVASRGPGREGDPAGPAPSERGTRHE